VVSRVSIAALVATSALVIVVTANAGYSPTPPPGPAVPGGFSIVIASKTFGPAGGNLSAKVGKTRLTLHVNRGALSRRILFTFTRPRLANLRNRLPHGTVPVMGIALLAMHPNGRFITGKFGKSPVRVTVRDRRITKRSKVLSWSTHKKRFVRYGATIKACSTTAAVNRIHELVVTKPE
jgi:hypothetical protein